MVRLRYEKFTSSLGDIAVNNTTIMELSIHGMADDNADGGNVPCINILETGFGIGIMACKHQKSTLHK